MGGILGGLLAGGLLAALFGSGAFEGIQFMDILIIAVLAFILFKIFRSMQQAKAGAQNHNSGHAYAGSAQQGNRGYYHEQNQDQNSAFRQAEQQPQASASQADSVALRVMCHLTSLRALTCQAS